MAHDLGCSGIPDINEYTLENEQNQIVIASDGVWEVYSNSDLLRLLGNDAERSAINIVDQARKKWLQTTNDMIQDDITCIVIHLGWIK